jgi:hypothetical protein
MGRGKFINKLWRELTRNASVVESAAAAANDSSMVHQPLIKNITLLSHPAFQSLAEPSPDGTCGSYLR